MSMTSFEIEAVLGEIAPAITGGKIQKIGEPRPKTLLFEIRAPGRTHHLLISLDPTLARLHFVTRSYSNPPTPPPLCRFLRARLSGGRIDDIRQINRDRIVRLNVAIASTKWSLVAELLGKQAGFLVLDADECVVMTDPRVPDRIGRLYEAPIGRTPSRLSTPSDCSSSPAEPIIADGSFPISAGLEERYERDEKELTKQRQAQARQVILRKSIKKQERLMNALAGDLTRVAPYERYARYGELLKGALSRLQKGQPAITLVDYFDERLPELTIPLDPAKTPQGNLDDYFAKHKKFLRAQKEIVPRMEAIQRELHAMRQELAAIAQGTWSARPTGAATPSPVSSHAGSRAQRRGPYRRFISIDGLPIYVGRNARENDALTFTLAKSDDLWLHAQGSPGSHVIIRLEKGTDPSTETLKDAATLALLYSDLKKAGQGEVIYTRRKWVRKAKGAAPGSVMVTRERSLFIRLEPGRLDGLKQRSAG